MAVEVVGALTAVFIAASIVLFVFNKLSHPAIPAYIIAGLAIGRFVEQSEILGLAQIGIAFLVFIFGAKIDLRKTLHTARENAVATLLQVGIVGIGAYGLAYIVGFDQLNAVYIGIAASLSSSLVGTELIDGGTHNLMYGRISESINLLQDLIAIGIFLVLVPQPFTLYTGAVSILIGGAIIALGFLARLLFPYVAEFSGGSRELMLLTGVSVLAMFALLSGVVGLSLVVGAFAGGIAVSKFPYNLELLDTVSGLKDFFAAIFFVSLGALVDVSGLAVVAIAAALVFASILLKPAIIVMILHRHGYDSRTAYLTALNMDQMSEFALIVAIQAFLAGTMMPAVFHSIILAAIITMVVSSYTSRHADSIYEYLMGSGLITNNWDIKDHSLPDTLQDHVVIGGYDTQGREIVRKLEEMGHRYVVIDNDPEKIMEAREEGRNFVFGDLHVEETWERAQADRAQLIISTAPFHNINRTVLSLETGADRIVRATTQAEAAAMLDDCLYVIYPDLLASEKLLEHLRGVINSQDYRERLREQSREELS